MTDHGMTEFHRQSPIRHLPVAAALLVAVAAIVGLVAMPGTMLEELVWRTGVAALIPAAQPPLGTTARVVLALATAVIGAAVTWSALFLLVGPGGLLVRPPRRRDDGVPVVRRADAHPDAPPRRPMTAADLGTPMMEVTAANPVTLERSIPADLDQPLAAFDPHAILPVPMAPIRPVTPLVQAEAAPVAPAAPVEDEERVEELADASVAIDEPVEAATVPIMVSEPVAPRVSVAWSAPSAVPPSAGAVNGAARHEPRLVDTPAPAPSPSPPSIESLLRRLEQGATRRRQATSG